MGNATTRLAVAMGIATVLLVGAVALASAQSIFVEVGNTKLTFSAVLRPKALKRSPKAPVSIDLSGRFETDDGSRAPVITGAAIDIDRDIAVDAGGVPACTAAQLENQSTENAEAACRPAIVGTGTAQIEIALSGAAPIQAQSRLLAFNGGAAGATTTVFLHAYITSPAPEAIVVPVTLAKRKGSFGIRARVAVPRIAAGAGSLTGFTLTFQKRVFSQGGRKHGYLMARCSDSNFVFNAEVEFADGNRAKGTLVRPCVPRK